MSSNPDIKIRIEGRAGRITLEREDKFNALTYEMLMAIEQALLDWQDNDDVALVMIEATSTKAFCAGGDIQKLYQTGIEGEYEFMRRFWADEYRLNALIANYSKPYVAFLDGVTMGGGVGISAHGSHRIVTSRTVLAMPECAIGLVPDVGGTFLLAKAPGHVGEFMGLTGARLNGPEAIYAGFADTLIDTGKLDALKAELIAEGDAGCIDKFACSASDLDLPLGLEEQAGLIESYFAGDSAMAILSRLEESHDEWASKQAKLMRQASPLSIACTWSMLQTARSFGSVEQALSQEFRFVWRSMQHADILDGIRAMIIDRDRNPKWKMNKLEDVTDHMVNDLLASLGENELVWK